MLKILLLIVFSLSFNEVFLSPAFSENEKSEPVKVKKKKKPTSQQEKPKEVLPTKPTENNGKVENSLPNPEIPKKKKTKKKKKVIPPKLGSLELGFREGFSINTPSNLGDFSLKGYNPGGGLSADYYLFNPIGIHIEGSVFFTKESYSIFFPASIRYKFINSQGFDSFIGIGGFGNYFSSTLSAGALGELGFVFKLSDSFSLNTTFDVGHTFIPEQSTSVGVRFGGAFLL